MCLLIPEEDAVIVPEPLYEHPRIPVPLWLPEKVSGSLPQN